MKIHNEVRTNARRIVAMALALCLVFCTIPFAAGAEVVASGTWGDNVTWSLEDGVLTISGEGAMDEERSTRTYPWHEYRDLVTQVVVKSGVTSVPGSAFYYFTNLEKAVIEEGVESLGRHAFSSCKKLKEVQLPSTLKIIDADCFMWTGLETIDLPDGLEEVYAEAFLQTPLTEIVIPDSVTYMGNSVFSGCTNLKSAVLSANCTDIQMNAFWNCTALEQVTIPEGVISIASSVFNGCTSLDNVILPSSIASLHPNCFANCTSLTSMVIPAGVTTFYRPFVDCSGLKTLIFLGDAPVQEGNTDLSDDYAFQGVTANIYYPAGNDTWTEDVMQQYGGALTWIPYDTYGTWGENITWSLAGGILTISGEGAMDEEPSASAYPWHEYRDQVIQVVVKSGVTSISWSAFRDCENMEKAVIEEGVESLGRHAFSNCKKLKEIQLPSTLKVIDADCFMWSGLETIDLPDGLEKLGADAFYESSLTEIVIPNSVTTMDISVFNGCVQLKTAVLSNNCEIIPSNVFWNCTALEEVTIPEGVTTLEWCVFEGCTSLKNVVLPSTMTTLHVDCFEGCTSLTSVVIPESVTYFVKPFRNCSGLKSMIFLGDAPVPEGYTCFLDSTAFEGVTANIYYPAGNDTWTEDVMQQYGGTLTWMPYEAAGVCGDNLTWILADGILTITGTGEMYGMNAKDSPADLWIDYMESITKVVIEPGVTSIGDDAFLWHTAIEEIVIPDTVTAIGQRAFMSCESLKKLEIPVGVTEIKTFTVHNCKNLTELILPEGLESFGRHAFSGCISLEKVVIPSTATIFDLSVFAYCTSLGEIWFTGDAPEYLTMVFDGVTTKVYYPAENESWSQQKIDAYNKASEAILTWIPVFPDVPEDEYYYEPVMWAVEHGITTGTGDGSTFSPERACTRAQVVTFLWRAAGCPEPQSMTHNFTDVVAGSYYEKAVIWAVEQGITSGKGSATTFKPDLTCSRAEVVTFLWRAKDEPAPETTVNPFPDVPAGSYYEQAVLWAVENEITTGRGNGNFAPADPCTRAHVVTFLYRAFTENEPNQ